ncbi:FCD domain-containing protein [Pararoseomonas sp. SCSIO 73927]|uniref:FadR/GntR family transcriptional regulator n=1 Tax=Pararoseomonas sp. SCSIO 73927 TaxID=3114537 RepID=UPI0030D20418
MLDPVLLDWHGTADLDANLIADLIELRRILEPEAARLAADRATAGDLAAIGAAYERMEAAVGGQGDYVEADAAFHTTVLMASHNVFLIQLKDALLRLLRLGFTTTSRHPNAPASTLPYHASLLHRLEARDGTGAADAVHVLIERNLHHLRGVLGKDARKTASGTGMALTATPNGAKADKHAH